jgi:hypothetical protein
MGDIGEKGNGQGKSERGGRKVEDAEDAEFKAERGCVDCSQTFAMMLQRMGHP